MKLDLYSDDTYRESLKNYILKDNIHVGHPLKMVDKFKNQMDRHPIVIINDNEIVVGFFYVHLNDGPTNYGYYSQNFALIRGLSIDERFQNKGYASSALTILFPFVNEYIDKKIDKLILAVDTKNISAIKAYKNAGFIKKPGALEHISKNLDLLQKSREIYK